MMLLVGSLIVAYSFDNRCKLGLLINPQDRQVEVYQLDRDTEVLDSPTAIDCSWLMPDFSLDLTEIF